MLPPGYLPIVPRDIELSRRRAAQREVVLVYLAIVREASLEEVSEATGIRPTRVVGIMEGCGREYAVDLSLCVLGAARRCDRDGSRWYRITKKGERAAEAAREKIESVGLISGAPAPCSQA